MVTANNIVTPLRSMVASGTAFARFADPAVDTLTPRLVYCGLLAFQLAFALRKLNNMGEHGRVKKPPLTPSSSAGLLPTHASDWAPSDPPPRSLEHSHAGVPLL